MRATKRIITATFLSFLLSSNPTSAFALSDISPFVPPFLNDLDFFTSSNASSPITSEDSDVLGKELRKRGSCPANYNSCSALSAAGSCCLKNAMCSLDFANQVACCPTGAVCTGTISIPTTTIASAASTGGFVLGGSTTTTAASTTVTSTQTLTTTPGPTTTTVLSNSYFPFPRIASTYPNSVACLSAYSACQTNYAICTADLAGGMGAFGVTISAENGGTTVVAEMATGTWDLGLASATSICGSLSSEACLGIQRTQCEEFGGEATTTIGFVVGTSGGGRCGGGGGLAAAVVVVAAGVGLGLVGQMG